MRVMVLAVLAGALLPARAAPALETWVEPQTGMLFVAIAKGCFQMGSPPDAFRDDDASVTRRVRETEVPPHEVCLDRYWLGRFEVTRGEWAKLMAPVAGDAQLPVVGVSRVAAEEFAARLTAASGGKVRFRLPTEAEWEHACRAGQPPETKLVPTGDHLDHIAWYSSPYAGHPGDRLKTVQPVGTRRPNAYGLHDMLGNAWEWVADTYMPDGYKRHALYNPKVLEESDKAVIRGGGLRTNRRLMRCEMRAWLPATDPVPTVGFRLVREEVGEQE